MEAAVEEEEVLNGGIREPRNRRLTGRGRDRWQGWCGCSNDGRNKVDRGRVGGRDGLLYGGVKPIMGFYPKCWEDILKKCSYIIFRLWGVIVVVRVERIRK